MEVCNDESIFEFDYEVWKDNRFDDESAPEPARPVQQRTIGVRHTRAESTADLQRHMEVSPASFAPKWVQRSQGKLEDVEIDLVDLAEGPKLSVQPPAGTACTSDVMDVDADDRIHDFSDCKPDKMSDQFHVDLTIANATTASEPILTIDSLYADTPSTIEPLKGIRIMNDEAEEVVPPPPDEFDVVDDASWAGTRLNKSSSSTPAKESYTCTPSIAVHREREPFTHLQVVFDGPPGLGKVKVLQHESYQRILTVDSSGKNCGRSHSTFGKGAVQYRG
jgi:hypothetical protein